MRRHRQALQPFTEMNVTNLLDTAFILLMAFMIVAPTIEHGIDLDLPVVEAKDVSDPDVKTVTVVIEKAKLEGASDAIYLDDRRVTIGEMKSALGKKREAFPDLNVQMEVDRRVSYDIFAKAMGAVQSAGIDNVVLITEPPKTSSR